MAAPIEFRHYVKRATLEDIKAGAQYVVAHADLWLLPVLQFRYRERVKLNDAESLQWSEWQDVPLVREE